MQEIPENDPSAVNVAVISGIILQPPVYSHRMYSELFYSMNVEVRRLSGSADVIPVTLSEKLMTGIHLDAGSSVYVTGQVRSHILHVNHVRHKYVAIFALKIETDSKALPYTTNNRISLYGKISNIPALRITPRGRTVADIELAVQRYYHKMDFIPLVIWSRNALALSGQPAGLWLAVRGRIQSRSFIRRLEDGTFENGRSIEVSVSMMKIYPEGREQTESVAESAVPYRAFPGKTGENPENSVPGEQSGIPGEFPAQPSVFYPDGRICPSPGTYAPAAPDTSGEPEDDSGAPASGSRSAAPASRDIPNAQSAPASSVRDIAAGTALPETQAAPGASESGPAGEPYSPPAGPEGMPDP